MKHSPLAYPIVRTREAADSGNGGDRVVEYIFSTPEVARDGHTIQAWDLANFMRNPVFCWAHDTSEPPIGKVIDITQKAGVLTGSVSYATAEENPFADTIFRLVAGRFINATSVSWIPLSWSYSQDRSRPGGIDFKLADLLEISQVPVPSLPTALATARSAGLNLKPLIEWTERALDRNSEIPIMPKPKLVELRRAAGAPAQFLAKVPAAVAQPKFRSLGEQLQAIARCADGAGPAAIDTRLVRAPTGMGELDPSGGGFIIEPQFAEALVAGISDAAQLALLTDRRETSNPLAEVKLPTIDETSRADGSRYGGVLAYWGQEASNVSTTFPRWRSLEFTGKKLIGVAVCSSELVADVPMLEAHLSKAFAVEFGFKLDLALLNGALGTPLGVLKAPALITVAKESGQAAGTIVWENILNMWQRLPAPSRRRATWSVHEDAIRQLGAMSSAVGTSGVPVYLPANANSPTPRLLGAPVLEIEQASALGTVGDIVLADWSNYILIDGGTRPAVSVHARFLNDEVIFRFVLRIDGAPGQASPITPYSGANTRSPFVTLGAR